MEVGVTATGHGRIMVQELLCGPEVGEGDWRVFEPLATGGEAVEKRQGGRFTAKKKRKRQKLVSSFDKEEKGCLFTGSGERRNPSPKMAYRSI